MSDKATKLREVFQVTSSAIKSLEQTKKSLQQQMQACCDHTHVAEVAYVNYEYGSSLPPRRICEICGIEEDGWGSGYKILKNERVRVVGSRDEFYRLRALDFDLAP